MNPITVIRLAWHMRGIKGGMFYGDPESVTTACIKAGLCPKNVTRAEMLDVVKTQQLARAFQDMADAVRRESQR